MNRAMGFGIASSTMMATTLMATSVASAHERTISDPYGAVTVGSTHRTLKVTDHSCTDADDVAAQYKYQSGGTTYTAGTGAGAHTCGQTISRNTPTIVSFRKCLRDGGTVDDANECGDWVTP